ncbi:stalk domain-containing protein [Fusibacter ferrireducens]|uniref:Copper amine oxidase-like N-terminal domain-containing protein n=1 Tax=Fusibacter ferrireducens TaxID=2785058 RepID=A0ABR9ZXN4_9FIRM|nr:stalk domain-containing protein [Fusibacter ferrireducens]MBF4694620.1 hypothetical protein [Fusibacter ferrireducens]
MKNWSKKCLFQVLLLGLIASTFFQFTYGQDTSVIRIVEVIKANEESSYQKMFTDFGMLVEVIHEEDLSTLELSDVDILIITQSVADHCIPEASIVKAVGSGMQLIVERHQSLGRQLGVDFGTDTKQIDGLIDKMHPTVNIFWDEKVTIPMITNKDLSVHCLSSDKSTPVVVSGQYQKGSFVYSTVGAYVNETDYQYYRIPFMMQIVSKTFALDFSIKRDQMIVYMDWGYYYDQDPEQLAQQFKKAGISEVHLSAWYEIDKTKTFYDKFINACNGQGILVYAWFEFPMVTEQFWHDHPEWREKTGTLEDAHVSWRYLMAMENPACMDAIKAYVKDYLGAFNWDGVDIAELYFESPDGFKFPETFTPLSDDVRSAFKAKTGVDPIELFDASSPYHHSKSDNAIKTQFLQYRRDLVTALNEEIISSVKLLKKGGLPYSIYVTQIESIKDSKMYDNIGVDANAFIKLQNKYDFFYIVEDPFTLWALGPARYSEISKHYKGKMNSDKDVLFDINIVERSRVAYENLYPTAKQTGLELYDLIAHAMSLSDRVCLYAAHTLYDHDYEMLPYVMAHKSQVEKVNSGHIKTQSENTFKYLGDMKHKEVLIDGQVSPFVNSDFILIPSGTHDVEFKVIPAETFEKNMRILDFNGEIKRFKSTADKIELEYQEKRNGLITINFVPTEILLDDVQTSLEVLYNGESFTVKAPLGKHKLTLVNAPNGNESQKLFIQGKYVHFESKPLLVNNNSLYRAEELLSALGVDFDYHSSYKTYTGGKNGYVFWIQLDNPYAKANGKEVYLETVGIKNEDINYVPLKFICQALNFKVSYIPKYHIVTVNAMP